MTPTFLIGNKVQIKKNIFWENEQKILALNSIPRFGKPFRNAGAAIEKHRLETSLLSHY